MSAGPTKRHTTQVLNAACTGDGNAAKQLMPQVYQELREQARRYFQHESSGHTLQPTALVNEAYLKLVDQTKVDWQGRTHFFAVGAQMMRRVLVDHARAKQRVKRGGGRCRIPLDETLTISPQRDEDVLALDDALEKLAQLDARQAKIVELRFFGGLTVDEVAEVLGISPRTVTSEWAVVRAWLRCELSEGGPS
jgi:RNA polymerase sigma-70 factor (ECF subfamily)